MISDKNFNEVQRLDALGISRLLEENRFVYLSGWQFREPQLTLKHREKIINFFSMQQSLQDRVCDVIKKARSKCNLLIGIHIRRGDYQYWQNGRYFYEVNEYAILMNQIVEMFKNQNVGFFICSNEKLDEANFSNFNYTVSDNEAVVDLYSLAKCDLILGPPSTFTQWASYFGESPLCHVYLINQEIRKDSFSLANIDIIPG